MVSASPVLCTETAHLSQVIRHVKIRFLFMAPTRFKYLAHVVLTTFCFSTWAGSPGKMPVSKKEAFNLVRGAFSAMDLTSPGSTPFHLLANVHYELGRESADGEYELLWSAPDRWRENFRMERVESEVNLALGDKLYVLRSGPAPSLPLLRAREILHPTSDNAFTWSLDVRKVLTVVVNGQAETCVDARNSAVEERVCMDSDTGTLLSVRDNNRTGPAYLDFNRTDFACIDRKCFPHKIESRYFDEHMDVRVTTLEHVARFSDDVFTAPPNSVAHDWCALPTANGKTSRDPFSITISPPRIIAYWLSIAPNGRVENVVPLRPGGAAVDNRMERVFRSERFPTRTCGQTPVGYDELFYLPSHMQ